MIQKWWLELSHETRVILRFLTVYWATIDLFRLADAGTTMPSWIVYTLFTLVAFTAGWFFGDWIKHGRKGWDRCRGN